MCHKLLICAASVLTLPTALRAEVLTFTVPVVADFEFSFLPGPFNPGMTPTPFIPFQAAGDFTFGLDSSLNSPATTVPFTSATASLTGVLPSPPLPGLPYTVGPFSFVGGSLTNIVRDGMGEVISADVDGLSMLWEMFLPPELGGLRLYTQDGLPFSATGVTIPFALGTVLSGPAPFDVFLDTGMGDMDPLVIIGQNRTLSVVPEPTSLALLGLTAAGFSGLRLRRRRRGERGFHRRPLSPAGRGWRAQRAG